MSRVHADFQ